MELHLFYSLALLAAGLLLIGLRLREARTRPLRPEANFPALGLPGAVFVACVLAVLLGAFTCLAAANTFLQPWLAAQREARVWEILVFGLAFHGGSLLGFAGFRLVWRTDTRGIRLMVRGALRAVLVQGARYLLLALPFVAFAAWGWKAVLEGIGLEAPPQELVQLLDGAESRGLQVGLLLVAVVLVPVNEELVFRGLLYGWLKDKMPAVTAMIASSVLFAIPHGNLATFAPLVVLGVMLCLVVEKTGDLRAGIFLHALFNLNTMVLLFLGATPGDL